VCTCDPKTRNVAVGSSTKTGTEEATIFSNAWPGGETSRERTASDQK